MRDPGPTRRADGSRRRRCARTIWPAGASGAAAWWARRSAGPTTRGSGPAAASPRVCAPYPRRLRGSRCAPAAGAEWCRAYSPCRRGLRQGSRSDQRHMAGSGLGWRCWERGPPPGPRGNGTRAGARTATPGAPAPRRRAAPAARRRRESTGRARRSRPRDRGSAAAP